ncbi:alanine racemase [Actinorugispora endophytica]|uniref:Diaminopimelate decarboxylase n=1 Tax=Actinorugispora endophytica TaxID=1605990 RepID=A0A4R6V2X0_9ACTN|nr:alanine racemase [Actinorugispora endophytica]TDQ54725.1 diaminopimelate decarboxylase [Actinorugispora endophytica]
MIELPRRVRDHALTLPPDRFPVWVCDLDLLDERTRGVRALLPPGVELHYRAQAAPDPGVITALAPRVDGFEAASGDELERVRAAAPGARTAFGGPGKTAAELARAVAVPGTVVHVESPDELRLLANAGEAVGRDVDVLLRVSPPPVGDGGPEAAPAGPDVFGMDPASLVACAAVLAASPRVRLRGFAVHVARPLPVDAMGSLTRELMAALRTWSALFDLADPCYAISGGMAADRFDWACYGRFLAALVRPGETLRITAGRSLTAGCGWYLTRVIDVKRTHGRAFAVVDGPSADVGDAVVVPRDDPAAWTAPWPRPALEAERVAVAGRSPASVPARPNEVDVDRLRPGDVLAFLSPGTPAPTVHYVTGDVRQSQESTPAP